jgi:hypothetical protein
VSDTGDGTQLWGQTYDRTITATDLFSLQDELVQQVVSAITGSFGALSRDRLADANRKPPVHLDSYDCGLRAYEYMHIHTPEKHLIARGCLESAVTADSEYADAWSWLGYILIEEAHHEWNVRDDVEARSRSLEIAQRAVELDPESQTTIGGLFVVQALRGASIMPSRPWSTLSSSIQTTPSGWESWAAAWCSETDGRKACPVSDGRSS